MCAAVRAQPVLVDTGLDSSLALFRKLRSVTSLIKEKYMRNRTSLPTSRLLQPYHLIKVMW